MSRLLYVWISTPKNDIFRAVQVFYLPLLEVIFKEETNTEIKSLFKLFCLLRRIELPRATNLCTGGKEIATHVHSEHTNLS